MTHSLVFSCLHLPFPEKKSLKKINMTTFLCHWSLSFSLRATPLLPLPLKNPLRPCQWTMLASKYVFRGPQTPWFLRHFFLGVNRSDHGTSSTTNHMFFSGAWDDFMVRSVNIPSVGYFEITMSIMLSTSIGTRHCTWHSTSSADKRCFSPRPSSIIIKRKAFEIFVEWVGCRIENEREALRTYLWGELPWIL